MPACFGLEAFFVFLSVAKVQDGIFLKTYMVSYIKF